MPETVGLSLVVSRSLGYKCYSYILLTSDPVSEQAAVISRAVGLGFDGHYSHKTYQILLCSMRADTQRPTGSKIRPCRISANGVRERTEIENCSRSYGNQGQQREDGETHSSIVLPTKMEELVDEEMGFVVLAF